MYHHLGRKKKESLKLLEQQVRISITDVSKTEEWISTAQQSITQLMRAKEAVHIKNDLTKLKPFVELAKQKKDKLAKATERVGSAHKEVSDRVEELEHQLRELQSDVRVEEKKKKKVDDDDKPESPSATGGSLDSVEGSLDDLLKELE
jgi:hypothetical protein